MSGALWIYGIAPQPPVEALGQGVAGAAVRVLPAGPFAALVSDAPAAPPAPNRRSMLAHAAVLERAMAGADLLPVRFGTVAPDEGAIATCLDRHAAELRAALADVAGCVELSLRVAWRDGVVWQELLTAEPGLRARRDRLAATRADTAAGQAARVEFGRAVEAALAAHRDRAAAALLAPLEALALRSTPLPWSEEAVLLHRAFLVPRAREAAFDAAVAAIEAAEPDRLALRYVGPVPPFNFVAVRAGWLGAVAA